MNPQCTNRDTIFSAVVFMNNAVIGGTGHSPFEILYGQRPKFPLVPSTMELRTIPVDAHEYVSKKHVLLQDFRTDMHNHVEKSQRTMVETANAGKGELITLQCGDYVYLGKSRRDISTVDPL